MTVLRRTRYACGSCRLYECMKSKIDGCLSFTPGEG